MIVERPFAVPVAGPVAGGEGELFCLEVSTGDAEADAQPTILLHGGPGASHDYLRPQLDALASSRRRLVYYDQRGGGRSTISPALPPAGIDTHLADLAAVIEAVAPTGTARPALVGYSWGGLLALHHALRSPQSIDQLLLIAPAPPYAAARDRMRANLRAAAERPDVRAFAAGLDRGDRRQRFAAMIAGYFYDPRLALEVTPFVVHARAERGVWESLAGYDLRPELPRLAVPTRIIHGDADPIPIEASRETARLAGCELVELPRCGHVPYVEAQAACLAAARAFLG